MKFYDKSFLFWGPSFSNLSFTIQKSSIMNEIGFLSPAWRNEQVLDSSGWSVFYGERYVFSMVHQRRG